MDTTRYAYNAKSWKPSPTTSDYNSFFHAAFGTNESGVYFDKQTKFRRMRCAAFLTYFENEDIPFFLADILRKRFSVNDKCNLTKYIADLTADRQPLTEEDIPVLATLENIKVVVLSNKGIHSVTVIEPNLNIFGSYSKEVPKEKPREVVLCFDENVFTRLEPVREDSYHKSNRNKVEKKSDPTKYRKGGSAGCKGVEYQVRLLTMVILNAMRNVLSEWKLSTENEEAGKFDDIVWEEPGGDILIQSKHKEHNKKRITLEELTSTNSKSDDFSLAKYFLSYMTIKDKFTVKNIIICTNADVHEKAMKFLNAQTADTETLLHYDDGKCSYYTINDTILPDLKEKTIEYYDQNFKNKGIQKTVMTDENFSDFFNKLQLYFNYPSLNDLKRITENLLSSIECCSNSHGKITPLEMYSKVMGWFQQRDGVHLTEIYAKAIFAEIWTDKYCQKLKHYKVSIQKNDLNFPGPKQIFHVTPSHDHLLQAIKVYYAVQKYKEKILFVNPNDDINTQKLILEAFALPQYVYLIVIQVKVIDESIIIEMCTKLQDILDERKYKKVVLMTRQNDAFLRIIGCSENDYEIINGSVAFADLSKVTQEKLLKKKCIVFQGKHVSLKELLIPRTIRDYVETVNLEILEQLIKGEVKVGVDMNKNIIPFYINRTFKRSVDNIQEDNIYDVNENVVLISNGAGGGKSTVLSKLANNLKEKYPHLWVIKIALAEYTYVLRNLKNSGEHISIMKLLNSKRTTKLSNNLEKLVFSMDTKIILMLDGIDEVSPDYTELVHNLLTQCLQATNFAKLFVTTRPHMVRKLENLLKVEPFELQPFTEQNQVDFLTGYWMHHLDVTHENKEKFEQYAKVLIHRMSSWTKAYDYGENDFTAIALQLKMLAEISKETIKLNKSTYWKSGKEYLEKAEVDKSELPDKIEIKKLYNMFIETKRRIYIHKGNPSGNSEANTALVKQFNESLAYHKRLALEVILNVEDRQLFWCYQESSEDINESVLKIGIVQRSNEGFYFSHRTFAEYFMAESLVDELQLQSQNPRVNFQVFFIEKVLRLSEYQIVRAFLENFLQKVVHSIPSNIFKSYQSQITNLLPMEYDDCIINLLAKEGCVAILQLILKCIDFKFIKDEIYFAGLLTDVPFNSLPRKFKNFMKKQNMLNVLHILLRDMGLDVRNSGKRTPLLEATRNGNFEMVKFLVELGAKIDGIDKYGFTALHLAAGIGHVGIVKYLVELGAKIDFRSKKGYTPLHVAVAGGDLDCVKYLIQSGADVAITNNYYGRMALHFAAMGDRIRLFLELDADYPRRGQLAVIEFLVKLGIDVNIKDKDNCSPLHFAARDSDLDIVKLLHELGGYLTVGNNCGKVPLHLAAERGHLDITKYLIETCEDADIKDNDGCTPLHLAAWNGHIDTVKFLHKQGTNCNIRNNIGRTALLLAADKGDLKSVEYLVKFCDDVNIKDNDGWTALHLATWNGYADIVKCFHKSDADLNIRNNRGKTALHLAAQYDHLDCVKYLITSTDINLKDNDGCTALHLAASDGHLIIVKFLHEMGADLNMSTNCGKAALHLVAETGFFNSVKYLITFIDIDIKDSDGCTALHLAAWNGHLKTVKLLQKLGADLNIRNNLGKTALHLAAENDYLKCVKCLVKSRGVVNIEDNDGYTPLRLAVRCGHIETVKFLRKHRTNCQLL